MDDNVKWRCQFCKNVVQKLPPRAKHSFKKVQVKKSGKKSANANMKQILTKFTFNVKSSKIQAASKGLNAISVDVCPNFEVPYPVQVGTSEDGLDPATKAFEKHVQSTHTFSPILALRPIPMPTIQSPQTTPRKNIGAKRKVVDGEDRSEVTPIKIMPKSEEFESLKAMHMGKMDPTKLEELNENAVNSSFQTPKKAKIKGGTPKKLLSETPKKKEFDAKSLNLSPKKILHKSPRKSPVKQYKEDLKSMKQKSILNYFGNNVNS